MDFNCSNLAKKKQKYNAGSFYVKLHDLIIIFELASIKTVVSFNRLDKLSTKWLTDKSRLSLQR